MHTYFVRTKVGFSAECPEEMSEKNYEMLARIVNCVPRGGLFEKRGPADYFQPCGFARHCPWCHARSIDRLYGRLASGPCSQERLAGKRLVVGRLRIPSYMSGLPTNTGHDAAGELRTQVRRVRKKWGDVLKNWATQLGMVGGVFLYQVGPFLKYEYSVRYPAFLHELTVLGEFPRCSEAEFERFQRNAGMLPYRYSVAAHLAAGYSSSSLWATMPADEPQALRYLLFGSSYKHPLNRLGLSVSQDWNTRYGLSGAGVLQPWFLYSPPQFWEYDRAIRGTRLFDAFGSWRETLPKQETRSRVQPLPDWNTRRGRYRRRRAFEQKNLDRQTEAQGRREHLLSVAAPVYDSLAADLDRQPGSSALRRALAAADHPVSDRDARWLVKILKRSA